MLKSKETRSLKSIHRLRFQFSVFMKKIVIQQKEDKESNVVGSEMLLSLKLKNFIAYFSEVFMGKLTSRPN